MTVSRPFGYPAGPVMETLMTLKRMGARHQFQWEETDDTDASMEAIVSTHAPELLEVNGVGTVVASQLLVIFGDSPQKSGQRGCLRGFGRRRTRPGFLWENKPSQALHGS